MNPNSLITRRAWLAGTLAASLSLGLLAAAAPAFAHDAKCPVCKLDVPQDTDIQDNETAIRAGRKRIEYRSLLCALQDARSFNGDLTILAPSDVKGKPVLLNRKDGQWSVTPESVLFVGAKVDHPHCQLGYRAFTTRAAFDAWVHKNHELLGDAQPLNLQQLLQATGAGK